MTAKEHAAELRAKVQQVKREHPEMGSHEIANFLGDISYRTVAAILAHDNSGPRKQVATGKVRGKYKTKNVIRQVDLTSGPFGQSRAVPSDNREIKELLTTCARLLNICIEKL